MQSKHLLPPGCSPRTSVVGTDLRAVRPLGAVPLVPSPWCCPLGTARQEYLPWRVPYFRPVRRSDLSGVPALRTWRFRRNRPTSEVLEIPLKSLSLPRRCLGEVGFFGHPPRMQSKHLLPPGCSPRTSVVGTDLRAVRPLGAVPLVPSPWCCPLGTARQEYLPWRVPYFRPVRRSDLSGVPALRTWRFRRNRPTSEVLG